jgi:hypothetical protein
MFADGDSLGSLLSRVPWHRHCSNQWRRLPLDGL